jgi:broad specificity phosphatase PhoE
LVVAERLVDHLAAAGRLVIDDGKSLQQSGANARPGPLADFGLADSRAPGEAVQSAQSAHCEPLAQDPRLTEIDFGQWEGLPWDDIDRDAFDEWVGDYVNRAAPKGESWGDVRSRVATFINEMRVTAGRLDGADHTVVAVTHAGVMRAMASIALAIPLESTWHIHFPFDAFMELEIAADAQYDRLITLR